MNSKILILCFFQFLKILNSFEVDKKFPTSEKIFRLFLKKFSNLKSLETLNNSFNLSNNILDEKKYNSGFSFGIDNPVEIEISKIILNFLEKNKEPIQNSIILGCGAGGFSDITYFLALTEKYPSSCIFYNDLYEDLFQVFKTRIGLSEIKVKKIIFNFFELNLNKINSTEKFYLILANTSFHSYNERNSKNNNAKYFLNKNINDSTELTNSIEKDEEDFTISNFIVKILPEILKKNGSFILTCDFNFYLNNKPLILGPLENYLKKSLDKKETLIKIFNLFNEKKNLEKETIKEVSEELNFKNNFYSLSLFSHDFIENNLIFIENLKKNFYKIIINYPNNSTYNFQLDIILDEHSNEDLIYILRKNPLVTIAESFLKFGKNEFEEFLKTETQFGIFFQLFKN